MGLILYRNNSARGKISSLKLSHFISEIIQKTLFLTFQYDLLDLCDVVAGEGAEDTGAL